jgi:BON domain-containing protein
MFNRNEVPDKELLKTVNARLARTGTGSKVTATVSRGTVTLSGNLRYAAQRAPLMSAANSIAGIRQVIDRMQCPPKQPTYVVTKAPAVVAAPQKTSADANGSSVPNPDAVSTIAVESKEIPESDQRQERSGI